MAFGRCSERQATTNNSTYLAVWAAVRMAVQGVPKLLHRSGVRCSLRRIGPAPAQKRSDVARFWDANLEWTMADWCSYERTGLLFLGQGKVLDCKKKGASRKRTGEKSGIITSLRIRELDQSLFRFQVEQLFRKVLPAGVRPPNLDAWLGVEVELPDFDPARLREKCAFRAISVDFASGATPFLGQLAPHPHPPQGERGEERKKKRGKTDRS